MSIASNQLAQNVYEQILHDMEGNGGWAVASSLGGVEGGGIVDGGRRCAGGLGAWEVAKKITVDKCS